MQIKDSILQSMREFQFLRYLDGLMMKILAPLAATLVFAFGTIAWASELDRGVAVFQKGDCKTAVRIFNELAASGDKLAQYNLGQMHRNGDCVSKSNKTAFKWYAKSAQQGLVEAQIHVGWMYANGVGIKRDLKKAAIWTGAAASKGNKLAKENLASICFELGWSYLGGAESYSQDEFWAYVWFSLAERNGHRDTRDYLYITREGPEANKIRAKAKGTIKKCLTSGYQDCG